MIIHRMVDIYNASHKSKKTNKTVNKSTSRKSVSQIKSVIKTDGSDSMFSSFATFPKKVGFETQEGGETVILFLRQHIIVNLGWVLMSIILFIIPMFFSQFPPYELLPAAYQMVINLIWYLLLMGYMLSKFMHWFYTVMIATDERVIDIDLMNLFYSEVSDTKIDRIQDVSMIRPGSWHTFFDFGHIVVQTAGEKTEFMFQNISRPDDVVKILNQLVDLEEQEKIEGRVK